MQYTIFKRESIKNLLIIHLSRDYSTTDSKININEETLMDF